jgi:hypothetical protein
MSSRIYAYIRQNVLGLIAIYLALGGIAVASHPDGEDTIDSGDIINNQVKSADVRDDTRSNGGLAAVDLQPGSVGSSEVFDQSLGINDLGSNSVDSDELADNSVQGPHVLTDTLTGADVSEPSLVDNDAADGFDEVCDPDTPTFLDCDAQATVTLGNTMAVLVIATTHWFEDTADQPPGGTNAQGECRLERNDVAVSGNHPIGGNDGDSAQSAQQGGMNLVDVQPALEPATYTYEVSCNESGGAIKFGNIRVAAVELGLD